jgi:hypothetical protein
MFTDSESESEDDDRAAARAANFAKYCDSNDKHDNRCPGFCKKNPNSVYCRAS